MKSHGGATAVSDPSSSSKRPMSREVSSRFLSPTSTYTFSDDDGKQSSKASSSFFRNTAKSDDRILLLSRQRSFGSGRFDQCSSTKENRKPLTGGGSMRYTATVKDQRNDNIVPGRFSVDERQSSFSISRGLLPHTANAPESENGKELSYMAPTVSSRKHGIQVPSKFMQRARRWSADSGINRNSKANGKKVSESGVGSILSRGIEMLKGKKSSFGPPENVHQLRMLHNRLVQWRYCSGRAEAVNADVIKQAERSSIMVWNGLMKLRYSVAQKKVELQREKLEMKLNYVIRSQIKALEAWGNMESKHLSAVGATVDHLHYVVCRVPLVDGAKVEYSQSDSIMVRHASDLAASIELILTTFSPTIEKAVGVAGELATIVTEEKLMLDECFELFRNISVLEIQERSLKSSIMQLRLLQQHVHLDIAS